MAGPYPAPNLDPETAMTSQFALRRTSLFALLAIGGGLAAPAHGQQIETLTVEAAREVKVGQTTTGIPVSEITVRSHVNYADLDLTTDAGVKALKDRIREAAAGACKEMNVRVPAEGSSVESCTKDAVKSAMVEADKIIAAKRGAK
jgi:UrcA family protein